MPQFDFDSFGQQLQKTAGYLLTDLTEQQSAGDAARAVHELAENELARNLSNPEKIACRVGCGHCCIVNVAALSPEVDAIIDYLRARLTPEELTQFVTRTEEQYHAVSGLDDEERIMLRRSCLFLDQGGRCVIYPVRPLLCRALTSTCAESCRNAISMLTLGENLPIMANQFQQELFNQAFINFGQALDQAGLESRSQSLTSALRTRFKLTAKPWP